MHAVIKARIFEFVNAQYHDVLFIAIDVRLKKMTLHYQNKVLIDTPGDVAQETMTKLLPLFNWREITHVHIFTLRNMLTFIGVDNNGVTQKLPL